MVSHDLLSCQLCKYTHAHMYTHMRTRIGILQSGQWMLLSSGSSPLESAGRRLLVRKLFFFQVGSSNWGPANQRTRDRLTGEKTSFIYTDTRNYSVMSNSLYCQEQKGLYTKFNKRGKELGLQWEGMECSMGLFNDNGNGQSVSRAAEFTGNSHWGRGLRQVYIPKALLESDEPS